MTAKIAGFVSRAAAGLRAPKSVSHNITPASGGVAIHYGGPRQPVADPGASHAKCVATWKAWQTFHMNTHGWVDIAYTGGFCNHGYAFAGRGAGVRTAANGTNTGNQNFYAVVWIGGEGQVPTQAALNAADWWINELRRLGKAGKAVRPHRFFKSTGCPGNQLVAYANSRHDRAIALVVPPTTAPKPAPVVAPRWPLPSGYYFGPKEGPRESVSGYFSHREDLRRWQAQMIRRGWRLAGGATGLWSNDTLRIVRAFNAEKKTGSGDKLTVRTWTLAWTAPIR